MYNKKRIKKEAIEYLRKVDVPDRRIEIVKGKESFGRFINDFDKINFNLFIDRCKTIPYYYNNSHICFICKFLNYYIIEGTIYVMDKKESEMAWNFVNYIYNRKFEKAKIFSNEEMIHIFNKILNEYAYNLGVKFEIVENLVNTKGKKCAGINYYIVNTDGKYVRTEKIALEKDLFNIEKDNFNIIAVKLHELAHTLCNIEIGTSHNEEDANLRSFELAKKLFSANIDLEYMFDKNFFKFVNALLDYSSFVIDENKDFIEFYKLNPYTTNEFDRGIIKTVKNNKKFSVISIKDSRIMRKDN